MPRAGRVKIRIGLDEAGLGPTLGPLVIGAFATIEHAAAKSDRLRAHLAEMIAEPPCKDGRIEIGDSKAIHQGARKLARLERSALATIVWVHGQLPATIGALFELVLVREFEQSNDRRAPWWQDLDEPLPVACSRDELLELGARLRDCAERNGVKPMWYRADLLDAARVNRELTDEDQRDDGSKNTWSTHAVLRMAALANGTLACARTSVACDMAGGRRAYEAALRRAFGTEVEIAVVGEGREASRYRLNLPGAELELAFMVGGDRIDPRISWGSILAKYLRELLLRPFNRYFVGRVARLRPTAGYPEDARRFIDEVEAALGRDAGLERAMWIRCK
jgi:ribonuclease HII